MAADLVVEPVVDRRSRNQFLSLPDAIYRDYPNYVPPLRRDLIELFGPKSSFRERGRIQLFLAKRAGRPVGRIGAIVDQAYNDYQKDHVAFFGFFESVNDQSVADALFDRVRSWAEEQGYDRVIGPFSPSTNDTIGVLVEGFDDPPALMMAYNPPYYQTLMEAAGLTKRDHLLAYRLNLETLDMDYWQRRLRRIQDRIEGFRIRPIDPTNLTSEMAIIRYIYNEAWRDHWGFVPLSEAEGDHLVKSLKSIMIPELVGFSELINQPVGVVLSLPDYNQILIRLSGRLTPLALIKFLFYRNKITRARVLMNGVISEFRPLGVMPIQLFHHGLALKKAGFKEVELGWIVETNMLARRIIERLGAEIYKRYNVYHLQV